MTEIQPMPIYLTTHDPNLDRILAMDAPETGNCGGILCGRAGGTDAPVVLILGAAGSGKTTLALQIAFEAARNQNDCRVFFYSLEQSTDSLESARASFAFGTPSQLVDFAKTEAPGIAQGQIHLCHFAPLPISEKETGQVFEDRFDQLCHMLAEVKKVLRKESGKGGQLLPVFFIDSLNAIATSSLQRNDIYRLFAFFRLQGIPAIITAERHDSGPSGAGSIAEASRFLADIVIELSKDESAGHLLQYLEVSKSRIRRQALGKHLYKIRTARAPGAAGESGREDERLGLVVYRSIPYVLSKAREQRQDGAGRATYQLCTQDYQGKNAAKTPLYRLMSAVEVKAGACFALMGPPGTHKLALAMNLATGYIATPAGKRRRLLVVSFGGHSAIDLTGVAWFDFRNKWGYCRHAPEAPKPKWWKTDCAYKLPQSEAAQRLLYDDGGGAPAATQLVFRIGHLTPEECFDCIYEAVKEKENEYSAVLLSDTAEICTGFPLLRKDPLFLPALIDLFHERGLVLVCIGVQGEQAMNRDMDFALQSCADYRLYLSHYPDAYNLARKLAEPTVEESRQLQAGQDWLTEQLVSVVVDNVTGKHYGRQPRWLGVHEPEAGPKELFCGTLAEYRDWLSRARAAAGASSAGR